MEKNSINEASLSSKSTAPSAETLARLKNQSGMSGGGVRLPVLDRIKLNGNCDAVEDKKGNLVRPPISYQLMKMSTAEKDQRPESENIGTPVKIVFIKVRRRLVAKDTKGFQVMSTTQHGHPSHTVSLYDHGQYVKTGKAEELRKEYDELRTVQEIYVLHEGELKLLIVKGSALGTESRDKKLPTFYEYLQSINDEGIFSHYTILDGVLEKGRKDFYTMTFKKGEETSGEDLLKVVEHSDKLTELIKKYDEENAKTKTKEAVKETAEVSEETVSDEEPF